LASVTAIDRLRGTRTALITLENGDSLKLRLDLIAERGLEPGAPFPESLRRELEEEDQRRTAVEAALRLIALRPRSEKDLRDRLRRRGLGRPAVDAAIARMRQLGYLNDEAFARFWVESRQASTPRSRRYLLFELGRQGVERETAQGAVEVLSDAAGAYDAARRRLRQLRDVDYVTFQRRLGGFLASRGFGYGTARTAIERCWRELHEGESES
jgi:regulatory protein